MSGKTTAVLADCASGAKGKKVSFKYNINNIKFNTRIRGEGKGLQS